VAHLYVLWRPWNKEQQRNHAGAEDAQVADDIYVAEGRRLTVHLVVEEALGLVHCTERRIAVHARTVAGLEGPGHRLNLIVEALVAGL